MGNKNIFIRKTYEADMSDILDLLQSMSDFKPSQSDYPNIWTKFNSQKNNLSFVAVINSKIVGYGSILIETKIRGGKVGHIEDIVSHEDYRKQGIGKLIIDKLFQEAKKEGCYKLVLQCKKDLIPFYESCNYEIFEISMQRLI